MKRLLIISDNINICSRIDKILELKDNIVTTFATSSFTNLDSFKNVLAKKVFKYDLRKSEDLNYRKSMIYFSSLQTTISEKND